MVARKTQCLERKYEVSVLQVILYFNQLVTVFRNADLMNWEGGLDFCVIPNLARFIHSAIMQA